jgi:UDP-N-acetylmuramoylalanine--D-glutamate ligase
MRHEPRPSSLIPHASPEARARLASFKGRRVGVVGLGREGVDLTRFLVRCGAEVAVSDMAPAEALGERMAAVKDLPIRLLVGNQTEDDLLDCDEIFASPGVARDAPVVAVPAEAGIRISSATQLLLELYPGPTAGITGSSGKTTTTSIVASVLATAGVRAIVGGNMGIPVLGYLESATPDTWCVLELSSFQLGDLTRSPNVGVVLNIAPDHLDRHSDMDDYIHAKQNVLRFQSPRDTAVLNADDPIVRAFPRRSRTLEFSLRGEVEGAWFDGEHLWCSGVPAPLLRRREITLRGLHNIANALAATTICRAMGCETGPIAEALRAFQPVPHRLEVVARVDGVTYVNDSIATTPGRSTAGLQSFEEPIVLIAGGRDKRIPMEAWAQEIAQRARAVVLVGEAAPLIRSALGSIGTDLPVVINARRFEEAVFLAREAAQPGDVVLLSPGCTSFDEFADYAARGVAFQEAVLALARAHPDEGGPA